MYKVVKPTLLVLVGPSGSGKSVLEENLTKHFPDVFWKLPQVTTRFMRPGEKQGSPYVFVGRNYFEQIENKLVGVLGRRPGSLFKSLYGTFPDFRNDKVSTIILAEEAIHDLAAKLERDKDLQIHTVIVGLDREWYDLDESDRAARHGRAEIHAQERDVLKHAHVVWKVTSQTFVEPIFIVDYLVDEGILELVGPEED